MHKQSAQRALQFLENNYIMINSLESKDEKGCTDKILSIIKKHIKDNCNIDESKK